MILNIDAKQAPQFLLMFGFNVMFALVSLGQYQTHPVSILDGVPAPRRHHRADDILWMRTVWQRIDVRQKMNQCMYFPENPAQGRNSLYGFLLNALLHEQHLTAYSVGVLGDDDMLTTALSKDEVLNIVRAIDTVPTTSLIDGSIEWVAVEDWIGAEDVVAFEIKEHWFIDAARSVMDVAIVAIAPVIRMNDPETGEFRGTKRLFWLDYNEARFAMARWPVTVRDSDVQYLSYDDFFRQRRFDGTITKVSNVYDRALHEYLEPLEALHQAEREHEKIRETEMDMWHY